MTPRTFGKYLLDREIAHGGMARVHLARLRGLGGFEKRLVLKEIHPSLASDPRFVALFVEEAKTLVEMSHPHIVPVYELGVVDGTYFLAMEHVRGATLEALVAEHPLDPDEAAHLGAQVADALGYAHERFSLVHRDVTPRNVMVDANGHARLLDFGIAARLDAGEEGDAVFGTPGYLSPEQARGEKLTPRSDLFSLGAVLYRACTGEHAFPPEVDAMRALDGLPSLPRLDALPPELGRTIRAALSPDPAQRPASAKVMAGQLRSFLASRRPEGVADALGARADALSARIDARLESGDDAGPATPPAAGRTQSLATSPVLDELLGHTPPRPLGPGDEAGEPSPARPEQTSDPDPDRDAPRTQRIERSPRPAPSPPTADAAAPVAALELRSSWARAGVITLVACALAVWALSMARFDPPTREPEPLPVDFTPLEVSPPDAGLDASAAMLALGSTDGSAERDAGVADAWEHDAAEREREPREAGPRRATDARIAAPSLEGTGTVTVQALPWADVVLDGRALGRTPLRDRPLSAGEHALVLSCPPLGREVRHTLRIADGDRVRISVDLQASPPRVTERR